MVALLSGFKVDSSTLTMTTRPLPTAVVFAHNSAHYPPREIEAGQALSRELAKPGNFGKALDAYLKQNR
jgi:hypothetical protein